MVSYIMSNEALRKDIGENIRQMRLNAQLSQQALAEKTGLARSTIAAFEAGNGGTIDTMILLLRHLQKLHVLDAFETEAPQSPVAYARHAGKQPQRIHSRRITGKQNETENDTTTDW